MANNLLEFVGMCLSNIMFGAVGKHIVLLILFSWDQAKGQNAWQETTIVNNLRIINNNHVIQCKHTLQVNNGLLLL